MRWVGGQLFLWVGLVLLGCVGTQPAPVTSLDDKLALQWARFREARIHLLESAGVKRKPASRDDWERILHVDFSKADLDTLRSRQEEMVAVARDLARSRSPLSLDALRELPRGETDTFCAAFPKGGMLHVHPWGTLSHGALVRILEAESPVVHPKALAEELGRGGARGELYPAELAFLSTLQAKYGEQARYASLTAQEKAAIASLFELKSGHHPFRRFEATFTLIDRLLDQNPRIDAAKMMYDDFLGRARADRVTYVELSKVMRPDAAQLAKYDALAASLEKEHGVAVRFLASFLRFLPPEDLLKGALKLLELPPSRAVVGVNLVADETTNPALEKSQLVYAPILTAIGQHKTQLHLGTHAGELGDVRNVRDALLLGAERIGHGVALADDPVTLEYARLQRVPLEANLTSNVRLTRVTSVKEHPFLKFLRLGLRVSLSTDDEGIFQTDMNRECVAAVRETDIAYDELREMAMNSIETSFAEPELKRKLKTRLVADLVAFESQWKAKLARPTLTARKR